MVLEANSNTPSPSCLRGVRSSTIPRPRYLRGFRSPTVPRPRYLRGFRSPRIPRPRHLRGFRRPTVPRPRYLRGFRSPRIPRPRYLLGFQSPRIPRPRYLLGFQSPRIPRPCYLRCFHAPRCPLPCSLRCFHAPRCPLPCYLRCFQTPRVSAAYYVWRKLRVSVAYYICTTKVDFPATEAPGVRGVLRLYYKSRLSSHGSSGRPRRTTFVLQKSTFQPQKLRASPAYYICTTKVDFPATEAPGVRGVLRLYYKSRLCSHRSSGCPWRTTSVLQKSTFQPRKLRGRPWRTTFVLQNSIFQPRKSPAYYVCTTQVEKKRKNTTVLAPRPRENPQRGYVCMSKNAKTRRFWHRANAQTRRGVTFVCQKTQKHDGFGTAPTPKPAEGLRLFVKKGKNTMVLAPRQRRNPQRVDARTKKMQKTTVLAPRPSDYPQRVVRAQKET